MSLKDLKVTDEEFSSYGVISQPDTLTGTPEENKAVFDALIRRVSIEHINKLIDELSTSGAADMGTEPFGAVTATTVQAALEQIYALIGSTYSGTDGAGKVGFSGTSSIQASNVQAAIEAVQANLTAYIAKIKAATGAAEVGNAPIVGMTATNVQQALEELRKNIDNIVSGIIPGGSITSDMIQDGAVTEAKLSSDVAAKLGVLGGATTPQAALANLGAGVRPNLLINPFFEVNQRGQSTYNSGGYCLDCWKIVFISTGNYGVTAHDDYIEISAGSDRETRVDQFLENPNAVFDKTVTGTVLLEDGSLRTGTAEFSKSDGSSYATETLYSDADFELLIQSSPSQTAILRLIAKQNKTVGIKGVKLECGDTQTLAYQDDTGTWQLLPQPESKPGQMLAECQRYYRRISLTYVKFSHFDGSTARVGIPVSGMRIAPACKIIGTPTVYNANKWSPVSAELSVSAQGRPSDAESSDSDVIVLEAKNVSSADIVCNGLVIELSAEL